MTDRPFSQASIGELEQLLTKHGHRRPVMAKLLEELEHRKTRRAQQLKKEVKGVLDGLVKVEGPVPEDSPEYQLSLEDLLGE